MLGSLFPCFSRRSSPTGPQAQGEDVQPVPDQRCLRYEARVGQLAQRIQQVSIAFRNNRRLDPGGGRSEDRAAARIRMANDLLDSLNELNADLDISEGDVLPVQERAKVIAKVLRGIPAVSRLECEHLLKEYRADIAAALEQRYPSCQNDQARLLKIARISEDLTLLRRELSAANATEDVVRTDSFDQAKYWRDLLNLTEIMEEEVASDDPNSPAILLKALANVVESGGASRSLNESDQELYKNTIHEIVARFSDEKLENIYKWFAKQIPDADVEGLLIQEIQEQGRPQQIADVKNRIIQGKFGIQQIAAVNDLIIQAQVHKDSAFATRELLNLRACVARVYNDKQVERARLSERFFSTVSTALNEHTPTAFHRLVKYARRGDLEPHLRPPTFDAERIQAFARIHNRLNAIFTPYMFEVENSMKMDSLWMLEGILVEQYGTLGALARVGELSGEQVDRACQIINDAIDLPPSIGPRSF